VGARANRYLASLLAVGAGALAVPAFATAGSGPSGGASTGSGGATAGSSTTSPPVEPGNVVVSASGDGISLQTSASAFVRSGVTVTGTVPAGDAGDAVEIDQLPTGATDATWTEAAIVQSRPGGSFAAKFHTTGAGPVTVRALLQGSQASSATASPPSISLTVYRRSIATLYGPGLWGHHTACGLTLRRNTVGVANRTLPCGTQVQLYYKGSVITVPVIDRGPYANHANWDLTMATARALGMDSTGTVGAAALPSSSTTTTNTGTPTAQKR